MSASFGELTTLAILAAMPEESAAFLPFIPRPGRLRLGSFPCRRFRVGGWDCWLLTSGMGMARAARASQTIIDSIHPRLLVSVGIAGAVNPDLAIADVVVASQTCLLEHGRPGPLHRLARLTAPAWQAMQQGLAARRARLHSGTAVTTRAAQFIQPQERPLENPILEMETFGILQVSASAGIPLLSIRSISDGPQAPLPFDLEKMIDENDNLRIGQILTALLRRPHMLPQLLRMQANSRLAAAQAAFALLSALRCPGPLIS